MILYALKLGVYEQRENPVNWSRTGDDHARKGFRGRICPYSPRTFITDLQVQRGVLVEREGTTGASMSPDCYLLYSHEKPLQIEDIFIKINRCNKIPVRFKVLAVMKNLASR